MNDDLNYRSAVEIWKRIPNYSGYEVSNWGRIKSWIHKNGRRKQPFMLKLNLTGRYYMVQLWINGICYPKTIHNLVLSSFIGPRPIGMEACHNDGNGHNNFIDNLRWDYRKNNHADKKLHGTQPVGSHHHNAKFTEDQINRIRGNYVAGITTFADIARGYRVHHTTIERIIKRITWRHI